MSLNAKIILWCLAGHIHHRICCIHAMRRWIEPYTYPLMTWCHIGPQELSRCRWTSPISSGSPISHMLLQENNREEWHIMKFKQSKSLLFFSWQGLPLHVALYMLSWPVFNQRYTQSEHKLQVHEPRTNKTSTAVAEKVNNRCNGQTYSPCPWK